MTTVNAPQFPLTDNIVRLFYFFHSPVSAEVCNFDTVRNTPLPSAIIESGEIHRNNIQTLWRPEVYTPGADFKESIRQLFGADACDPVIKTRLLHKSVINLVNARRVPQCRGPLLTVSDSARRRLGIEDKAFHMELDVRSMRYHEFSTGFGIAVAELALAAKSPKVRLLFEALCALTRKNRIFWQTGGEKSPETSFGALVRAMLGQPPEPDYKRVYSHCYIRAEAGTDAANFDNALQRLALHYTDDYHISSQSAGIEFIDDFTNIRHAIAQEGSATGVLTTADSPEFLTHYASQVIEKSHIPMHLLAFHAEQAFHRYETHVGMETLCQNTDAGLKQKLQNHLLQLLNFNLQFFHPVVSGINQHSRIYRAIIHAKQLQALHKKLLGDHRLMHETLRKYQQQAEQREKSKQKQRYCRWAQWGVAGAAYLTLSSISKEWQEALTHWLDPVAQKTLLEWLGHYGQAARITLSSLLALVAFCAARSQCGHDNHEHGPADLAQEIAHILHYRHQNGPH